MRALLLATPILAGTLISSGLMARAEELAGPKGGAPIVNVQPRADGTPTVHVQPRANDFSPHSTASEAEQRRLSAFDAKQQKLDEALDKTLNICRC
jgi:hypothetical protein